MMTTMMQMAPRESGPTRGAVRDPLSHTSQLKEVNG
jgi:hypothetical protein